MYRQQFLNRFQFHYDTRLNNDIKPLSAYFYILVNNFCRHLLRNF